MTNSIVIMGVSGCGKTTLGTALADRLGWTFVEGDRLHPPRNVEKMAAGIPLDDKDREPFLRNVAAAIAEARGTGVIAACSALKRSYRDLLRSEAGDILFVLPHLPREALLQRLRGRSGHFMPPSLLESQLSTLEPPGPDEAAIAVDGSASVEAQLSQVLKRLQAPAARPAGNEITGG